MADNFNDDNDVQFTLRIQIKIHTVVQIIAVMNQLQINMHVRATNNGTYESTFPMKLFRKNFMPSNVISFQTIPVWYSSAEGRTPNQVGRPATCFPQDIACGTYFPSSTCRHKNQCVRDDIRPTGSSP